MQSEKTKAYKVGGHAELPASELTSWISPPGGSLRAGHQAN